MFYFCKPEMRTIVYILLAFLITACNQEEKTENPVDKQEKTASIPDFAEAGVYENAVLEINKDTSLIEVGSLSYINDNAEEKSAKALVDNKMTVKRVTLNEVFNGKKIETTFYYVKGKLLVSNQKTEVIDEKSGSLTEVRTYYDDQKRPLYTAKRSTTLDKNIEEAGFKEIQKTVHNEAMALDIINQQGAFATGFLGFLESGPRTFLVVGTETYNASLMIGEFTPTLKKLKMNEKNYMNKPLKVEFQEVTEPNGFSYQGLIAVSLLP